MVFASPFTDYQQPIESGLFLYEIIHEARVNRHPASIGFFSLCGTIGCGRTFRAPSPFFYIGCFARLHNVMRTRPIQRVRRPMEINI